MASAGVIAALALYPLLPGHEITNVAVYLVLVATAGVGTVVIQLAPWSRALASKRGTVALYTWSVLDILLVSAGAFVTGGAHSPLVIVYAVTTVFFAATYPRRGQLALLAFTSAAYLSVVLLSASASPAAAVVTLTALVGVGYVASVVSGRLFETMIGHANAREESESRASSLSMVAGAARAMSALDPERVLLAVVESALQIGFDAAEICMFDEDALTWTQAYHRGILPSGYQVVEPADTGVAGAVRAARNTIVIDDYIEWDGAIPLVRDDGQLRGMVASPVWSGGTLAGVLIAGRSTPGVHPHTTECLDLLAAQAGAALGVARQFEERRAYEHELHRQATHDDLTGLPNRMLLVDRIELARAGSQRSFSTVGVLFFDLDRFKTINDSLGHVAGDALLSAVGSRVTGCIRPGDTIARYGADEFTIVLSDTSEQGSIFVAERVLESFQMPFAVSGRDVFITPSIGIAIASPIGTRQVDLLREAAVAMTIAKREGGGRWTLFAEGMGTEATSRLDRETDLRHAVEHEAFELAFQPIISLASGRAVVVEALARWNHPERGAVEPTEFILLAETTGLIVPLGRWVLGEACRQARAWADAGHSVPVAVNLSPMHFRDPSLLDDIDHALSESRLPPELLNLEITEGMVMENVESAIALMDAITARGVALVLDDFGQGYSSLSYLKRFPLAAVKIDRAFVEGLCDSAADQAIVRSVVSLARELDMTVTAEGIETPEQLAHVRRLGCDDVQGYLLCRPVPANDLRSYLARPSRAVIDGLTVHLD